MGNEYIARLFAASIFLWTAAVPDFRTRRIPLWIPGTFLAAAVMADLLLPSEMAGIELWMGTVPGAVLLILSVFLKGKLGGGDGICLIICGLITGLTAAVMIAETAMVLAAFAGCVCLCSGKWNAADRIAFVPFLAAASSLILIASGVLQ